MNEGTQKPFFVSALLAYGLYLAVTVASNVIASIWYDERFPGSDQGILGFAISWLPSLLFFGTSLIFWRMSKFALAMLLVMDAMSGFFVYSSENKAEAIQNLTFVGGSLGYTVYAIWLYRLGKLK
jgi:hypothetical protein